jgi:hypothetical protein
MDQHCRHLSFSMVSLFVLYLLHLPGYDGCGHGGI